MAWVVPTVRSLKSLFRPPAVQALLLQCAAFVLISLLLTVLDAVAHVSIPLIAALLVQGAIAAGLTYWRGLDTWWLPIQCIFPVALIGMQALAIPPIYYLLLFIALTTLFWSTFRTRVPYFPSHLATWQAVDNLLPNARHSGKTLSFIDIGSGFGGLALYLAKQHPASRFIGIEIAPLPWLISFLRARARGRANQFLLGDYEQLDFAQFDVVFAYLSPAAMPALWEKARAEMQPGSLLLSYEFKIPGIPPEITTVADKRNATIYGWHL
jgi:SAM-dependent methyltransferase